MNSRQTELTESSLQTYSYRLKLWTEWCEEQEIETVGELNGWVFEQYQSHRSGVGVSPSTLHNEMETLKDHIAYLERIEAVGDGLAEKVNVPDIPEGSRSRDTKLATDDALALIRHYRESDRSGSRHHALLELAWHTGVRLGSIRALDLRDYDSENEHVEFVHRPETGTPLKNKLDGERMVSLRRTVCRALDGYIRTYRHDTHDDYGRQPLFTSSHGGRPAKNTLRGWSYQATQPCVYGECPHGHDPAHCDYRNYTEASKCPSSRAPHHIRTGSITWHRDRGVPKEVTSERANASEGIVDEFYDKTSKHERMEHRRRPHIKKLEIEE